MMYKICSKCHDNKLLKDFYFHKTQKCFMSICKECQRQASKNNYSKNKNEKLSYQKEYNKNNKSRIRKNKESDKSRYSYAKSKSKQRKLEFNISYDEYVKLIHSLCYYCDNIFTNINSIGIGLDRIDNAKGYNIDNVLPCCSFCNRIKCHLLSVGEAKAAISAIILIRFKNS